MKKRSTLHHVYPESSRDHWIFYVTDRIAQHYNDYIRVKSDCFEYDDLQALYSHRRFIIKQPIQQQNKERGSVLREALLFGHQALKAPKGTGGRVTQSQRKDLGAFNINNWGVSSRQWSRIGVRGQQCATKPSLNWMCEHSLNSL